MYFKTGDRVFDRDCGDYGTVLCMVDDNTAYVRYRFEGHYVEEGVDTMHLDLIRRRKRRS